MNGKMKSCVKGLLMGYCGNPMPLSTAQKEPVAYLYNAMRLPDINTIWTDKETYPYAYITDLDPYDEPSTTGPYVYLTVCKQPAFWGVNGGRYKLSGGGSDNSIQYEYNASSGKWRVYPYGKLAIAIRNLDEDLYLQSLAWTNTDTGSFDGTSIYVAASDPVPVYE